MKVFENFDLTEYNSYRVKSKCKKAYFPENENDLLELYKANKQYTLLGSGHNIILSKEYYDSEFVIFNGNYNAIELLDDNVMSIEVGATMLEVSNKALEWALSGVEMFYDIPSSLGGAVVMNAGASGEEIKDVLLKVRFLDLNDLTIKELENEDLGFQYRNSKFQRNLNFIVIKAWLKLEPKSSDVIREKMESIKERRWSKQPKEFPNAGSVFKRPEGRYVGPMLDELGFKGFTIGGAQVSEKHSGFIINVGGASGKDILDVIAAVKDKVRNTYNIELEVEQRII